MKKFTLFLLAILGFAGSNNIYAADESVYELTSGAYYRIICPLYERVMTESGNSLVSIALDENNYYQVWKLTKNGTGYSIQNLVTERYVQVQSATSTVYVTGTTATPFYFTRSVSDGNYRWTIANGSNDAWGLHTSESQGYNVVRWYTNAEASVWAIHKVELTDEEIEAARATYKAYADVVAKKAALQRALNNLFSDKACTILKEEIQALTDEQLAANEYFTTLNAEMQAMVLKVKNNTWQQFTNKKTGYTADYEKFFRVADYKIYSHYQQMSNGSNFTMSNSFGKLSGPTGIVANGGDIIYVYVDASPKTNCTLQLEAVSTEGVPGNHQTGEVTDLKAGLNIFMFNEQRMLYIFHQLNDTKKLLANYPDIKIHIEGGQLNGYWDATRDMTNADWALLQQDLLKASPVLNLKTQHLVFCMNADLVKQCEPNEMEGLMRIWDMIPENEERYMGVEDFEGRFRNVWNCFSINYNYMFASTYGTYYHENTLSTIMNYENMRKAGSIWGPSHEMGHNHQASINIIGTTESSNNLFSNINTFEQGIITSRRQLPVDVFWELAKDTPWLQRNIWNTTSMFYQLYLYFHVQHHDDNFLPNLFRKMRKNPINKWSGPGNGGPTSYGKDDYLHLAKMICDVAEADLSEFFEAYGMFIPVNMMEVGDYSTYFVTTTQADITSAKRYMQKYPKKLGNIMFIDDHISPMKAADPDNKFEGKPASRLKTNNLDQHNEVAEYKSLPVGDVGDYEEYDGHEEYDVTRDYFTISGNTISFYTRGSGYVGHKFYDLKGNLIWATNAKKATLPEKLIKLGPTNYYVVAAEQNMKDVPCPYSKASTTNPVRTYMADVYFGNQEKSNIWYVGENTKLADYLPENAVFFLSTKTAPEAILQTSNVISNDSTASHIVINGNRPFTLPAAITADSVSFTKTIDGYSALNLPFAVTNEDINGLQTASYADGILNLSDAAQVEAGKPVVVNANVDLKLYNAALVAGNYQPLTNALVLSADGQRVEAVATASPFTYSLSDAVPVRDLDAKRANDDSQPTVIYDLAGRRLQQAIVPGIYIIQGRKVVVR
ncbi:MAG: M60 family metallopeptidase [Bacteroidaceae bacterium]|nr:M60 family metallopeptidase [Bacteroidaceae bacterium]